MRDSGGAGRLVPWLLRHSVDIVFGTVMGALLAYLLCITSGTYFLGDDWGLLRQGTSLSGMLEPYNDHLSLAILATYRVLIELFGFSYGPFRAVGLVCLLAPSVAYYLLNRRHLDPPLAALAALSLVSFGSIELIPANLNHYLAVVGAICCGAALGRSRRADWLLASALALSLAAAAGGVAVAVACVVHNALTRPHPRRWLAVAVPCSLWALWWLLEARGNESRFWAPTTPIDALRDARHIAWAPFDHLGLQSPILSMALALGYLAIGWWRIRRGTAEAAGFLAWSAALGAWAVGLTFSRGVTAIGQGILQSGEVYFRYQYVALGFVLLAIVPRRPIRTPSRIAMSADPRRLAAFAGALALISGAVALALHDEVSDRAATMERSGTFMRERVASIQRGPSVVPDDQELDPFFFFGLRAEEVRDLLDRYGEEAGVDDRG